MSFIKIEEDIYVYENDMVRFFLLIGNEYALLIDSGMNVKNIKETIKEITDLPIKLINTHADIDHIGGNDEFDEFMISPHELVNYHKPYKLSNIIPIYEGDIIDLGNRKLKVIELPGHTPGSIALLDDKGILFSGDPIQNGGIFMFGPMRNMEAYIISLKKLLKYENDIKLIYPSHSNYPVKFNLIYDLIDGANKVLNKEIKGIKTTKYNKEFIVYDIKVASFLCDDINNGE